MRIGAQREAGVLGTPPSKDAVRRRARPAPGGSPHPTGLAQPTLNARSAWAGRAGDKVGVSCVKGYWGVLTFNKG